MSAVQRLQRIREYGVPGQWTPPPMPRAQDIKPEMISKKSQANQMLDQVRNFITSNPTAQSLAGAGLGYVGSQLGSAVVNTVMPFDVDVDPNFVSGMGTMAGGLLGGPMIARALARRQQA